MIMKEYKSEADIKQVLFNIASKLSEIEVKGNSVEPLFISRVMLKELFDKIEEKESAKEKEE